LVNKLKIEPHLDYFNDVLNVSGPASFDPSDPALRFNHKYLHFVIWRWTKVLRGWTIWGRV